MRTSGGKLLTVLKGGGLKIDPQIYNLILSAGAGGVWQRDLSAKYQDSNATTGTTANGQPVGYWQDLGPFGNHFTQPGAESIRPVLDANGIKFDGGDYLIANGLAAIINGTDLPISILAQVERDNDPASADYIFGIGSSTAANPIWALIYQVDDVPAITKRDNAGTVQVHGFGSAVLPNVVHKLGIRDTGLSMRGRFDGVNGTANNTNFGAISGDRAFLGARASAVASQFSQVTVKGLFVIAKAMSDAEFALVESFLA